MKSIAIIVFSVICTCMAAEDGKKFQPGPCPDYPAMKTFDFSKSKDTWTTFSVYQTKFENETECQCGKIVHTTQADNTTFLQFSGTLSSNPKELFKMNSTGIPVPGKPGVFDVEYGNKDFLEEFGNATGKFYILDTDYESYSIGICCMENESGHKASATVDYKNINPPNHLLEKATILFKERNFDITKIKAVEQRNCPDGA
ncbi:hypothetical protein CHUAL_001370 [Chamberlinius hualienensis]